MSDILSELGLDGEDVTWRDLALCRGMETEWFYDQYEKDGEVAKATDEACLRCPVLAQCFLAGADGQYGVWGGTFFNGAGKPDKNKNSHKSEKTRDEIERRVREFILSGEAEDS